MKNTELELHKPDTNALAMTPATMLQAIVKGGITPENVSVFEKALEIAYKMEARDAEKQFNAAFVALQSDLPVIVAKSVIPNRGKYQKFEDVMDEIQPFLTKHGFTVSFSMDAKDNRILETCHLKHIGGHSQSNSFAVRAGKADNDAQADCKAATTAKRNALLNALNIVIRQDCLNEEDDAGIEGNPNEKITVEQADELEHRCQMTNSNIPAFLKYADATSFKDIQASRYDALDTLLKRKEQQGR